MEPEELRVKVRPEASAGPPDRLDRRLVALLAISVGAAAANLYYVQPLLPLLHRDLHVPDGIAELATTITQLGYVVGLGLVVPLGDFFERRRLACVLSLCCASSLLLAGLAPNFTVLCIAMVCAGLTAVVTHTLVPYAATLAPKHEQGRVVGIVMSGLLLGILLARTIAGLVAGASTWRVVFLMGAVIMALVAVALRWRLPRSKPGTELTYPQLLKSLVVLFKEEPVLRRRAGYGALSMGAFSVLWTSIAFLLAGAPYHYGSLKIGLFGLVGAAGALMATFAGRHSDRGKTAELTLFAALCMAIAFVLILVGAHSLAVLIVGIIVLDVGCQGMQITNQSEIYRLRPEARTRMNSVYMTMYFLGGTACSALSALLYSTVGWTGVCVLGIGLGGASVAAAIVSFVRPRSKLRTLGGLPGGIPEEA